jgi:hypothetical protein
MSTFGRTRTSGVYDAFYWIGVAMTLACFALVLAGNTEVLWRYEHTGLPLSWVGGVIAVLSFLAAEFCPLPSGAESEREEELALSAELEAVEF